MNYDDYSLVGSLSIGKGEQGIQGPVGPQGPIGDNNVCIGLSPTSEAEIWFDTNDAVSGEEIATKKFVEVTNEELSSRLDNLIISNGDGNKDSELIDARNGETTLGNKIRKIDESLDNKASKTYVTYAEFGAFLNGIDDDTPYIKECHEYANTNGLNVVQNNSIIVLTEPIEVRTNLDLSGSIIIPKISDDDIGYRRTKSVFNVVGVELKLIDVEGLDLTKGKTELNIGENLKGALFIDSTEKYMDRTDGGNVSTVFKKEPNFIYNNLLSYPLLHTYSNATTKVYLRETEPTIYIKAPKIIANSETKVFSIFNIERNNVVITDINLEEQECGEIAPVYSLINSYRCNNIQISNCNCEKIGRETKSGEYSLGYYLLFDNVSNITINNCKQGYKSWSGVNGNYFRDIKVNNCNLLAVNGHAFMSDINIENCTLKNGVQLMGGGYLNISNTTFLNGGTYCVGTKSDYAGEFIGTINIFNCNSKGKKSVISIPTVPYNNGLTPTLPNINIDGFNFEYDKDYSSIIEFTWKTELEYDVNLPKNINIRNVNVNTKKLHNTVKFSFTINDKVKSKELNIHLDNVSISKESYCIPNSRVWNATYANIIIPKIETSASDFKIKYCINNSTANFGFLGTNNVDVKCTNCEITSIRKNDNVSSFDGVLNLEIDNCKLYRPYAHIPNNVKISCTNSKFLMFTNEDGTKDTTIANGFSSCIVFSNGNVSEAGANVTGKEKLYNYIDTSYYVNS